MRLNAASNAFRFILVLFVWIAMAGTAFASLGALGLHTPPIQTSTRSISEAQAMVVNLHDLPETDAPIGLLAGLAGVLLAAGILLIRH